MGIIAPGTGIFAVQTYPNEPGPLDFQIDLGAGVFRVCTYFKANNIGAGTRVVHAEVISSYISGGGAAAALKGTDFLCDANTKCRTDSFLVPHDGSVPLSIQMVQTVAGAMDTVDATFIVEKIWEDYQS